MSLLDLSAKTKRTNGVIPPASVGASITALGSTVYVFGGRRVATREMKNDLYALDMSTFSWRCVHAKNNAPSPRYFHSANAYGRKLIIFGGMGSGHQSNTDALLAFNDVAIFDTVSLTWTVYNDIPKPPLGRYAHLTAVSGHKLMVLGGQGVTNVYISDAFFFDLNQASWTGPFPVNKECGSYRSLAATSIRQRQSDRPAAGGAEARHTDALGSQASVSPVSSRESWNKGPSGPNPGSPYRARRPTDASSISGYSLYRAHLRPKSHTSSADSVPSAALEPSVPIYVYSNYNFVEVRRELHTIEASDKANLRMEDISGLMSGATFPPGLRFPLGALCGDTLIISGTYLTNTTQTFAVWALNLTSHTWSRIDIANAVAQGSWNRAVHCDTKEALLIFGNRERSLVEDYNHRRTNFEHIIVVDLESFGVVETSQSPLSSLAQDLGMVLLGNPALSDMDIITQDKTTIPVSTQVLRLRWPTFVDMMQRAGRNEGAESINDAGVTVVSAADDLSTCSRASSTSKLAAAPVDTRCRCLYMPYAHGVVYAFVAYLHTDALIPAIEQSVPLVCSLLLMLSNLDPYNRNQYFARLVRLCRECLHRRLTQETASIIHETSLLTGLQALQIRSFRMLAQSGVSSTAEASAITPASAVKEESARSRSTALEYGHEVDRNPAHLHGRNHGLGLGIGLGSRSSRPTVQTQLSFTVPPVSSVTTRAIDQRDNSGAGTGIVNVNVYGDGHGGREGLESANTHADESANTHAMSNANANATATANANMNVNGCANTSANENKHTDRGTGIGAPTLGNGIP